MNVLVLNLPYPKRITRRYMCSYLSPTSLFPPLELLSVASCLESFDFFTVKLIDAVAEGISEDALLSKLNEFEPDYLITLIGFETFSYDINFLDNLKANYPNAKQLVFGHYPTHFKREIENNTNIDFVIQNEPEEKVLEYIFADSGNPLPNSSSGFKTISNNINLINPSNYFEPMTPRPLGVIQTARGCPYTCNFCVKSFGGKLNYKPFDLIEKEIFDWINIGKVKSIRFIDDTFTISKNRMEEIGNIFISNNLNIPWSCLSRIDTIDEETIKLMSNAGCKRIYFGIESGSQKILDFYEKGHNISRAHEIIDLCKKYKIETVGFFMTGLPQETDDDFEETLNFISESSITFAGLGRLTVYPGTPLYEKLKTEINFSLFPYQNEFKDSAIKEVFEIRQKKFNKKFYLSKRIFGITGLALKNPKLALQTVASGLEDSLMKQNPFIPSIEQ